MTIHDLVAAAAALVVLLPAFINSLHIYRLLQGKAERRNAYKAVLTYIGLWRETRSGDGQQGDRARRNGARKECAALSAHEINWRIRVSASAEVEALWERYRRDTSEEAAAQLEKRIIREIRNSRAQREIYILILRSFTLTIVAVGGVLVMFYNTMLRGPQTFPDVGPKRIAIITNASEKDNSASNVHRVPRKPRNVAVRLHDPSAPRPLGCRPVTCSPSTLVATPMPTQELIPAPSPTPVLCISCDVTRISKGLGSDISASSKIINDTLGVVSGLVATDPPAVTGIIGNIDENQPPTGAP